MFLYLNNKIVNDEQFSLYTLEDCEPLSLTIQFQRLYSRKINFNFQISKTP